MFGSDEIAGPSVPDAENIPEDSLHSEASKLLLKDAVVFFEALLAENDFIAPTSSTKIFHDAMLIGREIFESTLQMLAEKVLISDEELIHMNEEVKDEAFEKVDGEYSSDEFEPPKKKPRETEHYSLDYKIKCINIAKAHHTWSLKSLQRHGCHRLKKKEYLTRWEEECKKGGSTSDKYSIIDSWTYDRFVEARQNYQQVTTRNLQQWALAAAAQFSNFKFKASTSWVAKFKQKHGIRQRKVTKFVSRKETITIEETLAAAESFRIQARDLIPNFDEDFVINTDQTGCQYQSTYNRTLTNKGAKTVFVKRLDMNKVTHSYTAQYGITLSGRVLPRVFVCLQEATNRFGPRVQKMIDEYAKKYTNVIITSSKSGKLTTDLYNDFLNKSLKPYVGKHKFLLLVDSWGGQTKPELYDETFQDDKKLPTCTIKVIPPKCTPLVQPCDVYFYRQVKNFIKRLQNSATLIEKEKEITTREDCIKIQSIVHHQLSSPSFTDMIQYAWFASKLTDDRKIFRNVNEVCFSLDLLKTPCTCKQPSFICCSHCRNVFCFECFYDNYHLGSCK